MTGHPRVRRRGFTLVEFVMALAVLGIAARIGAPNVAASIRTARGSALMREVAAVEGAVAAYVSDTGRWPADAPPGEVPPELQSEYLPPDFAFTHRDYTLDYDHWSLTGGVREAVGADQVTAVAVRIGDPGLRRGLMRAAAARIWYRTEDVFGFLLDRP
jgi:prepilin-type N-terminal cleavage/methylation domain-containing protein